MKTRFIRVAERATDPAQGALNVGTHEKAGFLAYHAFESSGSALGTHLGLDMGKGVSHTTKLRRFQHAARTVGLSRQVALLAVRLAPMRNRFLYPEVLPDGTITEPEAQITPAKAVQLLKEVKHVVKLVKAKL
jgi:HEPN domain-containing protein